ncbi:hypothetical protein QZH41_013899 [Actinostola sp. cb2023]|nr:hypothetical protein QZH41_013899 [Actinostola sp. cb2023]
MDGRKAYRKYLRYDTPYKYSSARRTTRRQTRRHARSSPSSHTLFEEPEVDNASENEEVFDLPLEDEDDVDDQDIYVEEDCASVSSSDSFSSCGSTTESVLSDHDNISADPPIYDGAPLSVSGSNILILSYIQKHNLTGEAFADLLPVIEAHCPKPNNRKTSVKSLYKYFEYVKGDIVKHSFCSYCKRYIGIQHSQARNLDGRLHTCECGRNLDEEGTSIFIGVPIEHQIQNLFKGADFIEGLEYRFRRECTGDCINDVLDGSIYKEHFKEGGLLADPMNLSLKLNTDGVAVFKSSNFSVWPLFLAINELPPKLRTLRKYRLFTGLWFGEEKPFFSTFLKPFTDELRFAEIEGTKSVNGFKSPGPLFYLPSLTIANGIAIDYMHCVCLGVVKYLVGLWFNPNNSGQLWYCGGMIPEVDKRLLQIKPPRFINRIPRSIENHRKHWKAADIEVGCYIIHFLA